MKNKELIDYCYIERENCINCPYIRKECDQFIKETGCSPWMYKGNDKDKDFLSRKVGKSE